MSDTGVNSSSSSNSSIFELCLNVIEAEKSYNDELLASASSQPSASNLHVLVAAIQEVSSILNDIDEFMLYQVCMSKNSYGSCRF
jgi:hypothetical protein